MKIIAENRYGGLFENPQLIQGYTEYYHFEIEVIDVALIDVYFRTNLKKGIGIPWKYTYADHI